MKDFFRNNGVLILIVALLLALITAVVSIFLGGVANPVANLVGIVTTPVRNGVNAVVTWVEERYSDAFEQEQLKAENEALKQQVAELERQVRENESAKIENERYKSLLGLRQGRETYELESATVTAQGNSNWTSTLTISAGSSVGVAVNDCVVDQYWNLVGVVTEVGTNWATVTTVVDSGTELGGLIARTGGTAILEGDFSLMGEGRLKLSYLPENSELMTDDLILTSGRGGVYPSNLPVGRIESVQDDPSGMTRYAVIVPETDLDSLAQVFVITSFGTTEEDSSASTASPSPTDPAASPSPAPSGEGGTP